MPETIALARLLPWLATAAVVALFAVAAAAVTCLPAAGATLRRLRLFATTAVGLFAVTATFWQALEIAVTRVPTSVVATAVPSPSSVTGLQDRIKSLEIRVEQLRHSTTMRTIGPDTANKLARYLGQFGSRPVVVSCVPNDVEAYDYATQIVGVLKAAGWDARGPEVTTIFGDVRAVGINVYDAAVPGADTAKILLDGLTEFNIPFETRVAPGSAAIDGSVELFVGAQPTMRAAADGGAP
jgi:hypothetical protein